MPYLMPDMDKRADDQKGDDRVRLLKAASNVLEGADLSDVMFVGAELAGIAVAKYADFYGIDLTLFAVALEQTKKLMAEVAEKEFSEPGDGCATARPEATREELLTLLLRKAQNRLRNQGGDISEITERANLLVHDEIERELGGKLLLADAYAPHKDRFGGKL